MQPCVVKQCLFRAAFLGGLPPSPQKTYNFPQTAAKLCALNALNLFFNRGNDLQTYHGNFLLMDNEHRKLFVTKQSKGCKFMPKMHQDTFGGHAPPGPAGGAYALPQIRSEGLLLRE